MLQNEVIAKLNKARDWEITLLDGTVIIGPTAHRLIPVVEKHGYTLVLKQADKIIFRK